MGLALALLWSGVTCGEAGGLNFEPCEFQSVAWCVVSDAASAEDAESEAELRAELTAMSLIDLHKRAKDPHLLLIETDVPTPGNRPVIQILQVTLLLVHV